MKARSWLTKPMSRRNPIAVALAGLGILAAIAALTYFSGDLPFIGGGTTYTAYFAEAGGLQSGNEVRIAGVVVGHVTGVSLDGDKVAVTFQEKGAWLGNTTTAAIKIKTLLGDKYLALDPEGTAPLNPAQPIPLSRTTSPYDVQQAFSDIGQQLGQINTTQLAQSLQVLSAAFASTPPYVRSALTRAGQPVVVGRVRAGPGGQRAGGHPHGDRHAGQRGREVPDAAERREPAAG